LPSRHVLVVGVVDRVVVVGAKNGEEIHPSSVVAREAVFAQGASRRLPHLDRVVLGVSPLLGEIFLVERATLGVDRVAGLYEDSLQLWL